MGPRSPEGLTAKYLAKALDSYSFQPNVLAYMLGNCNTFIQEKLFNVFIHMIYIWAGRYDAGIMDDSEIKYLVNSKRIQEALEKYGYIYSDKS